MRPLWRRSLYVLAALLLLLAGVALWLIQGFDGERVKRVAIDWMRTHHARELAFDGPVTLRLWPQPAVTVQRVRLSEPGQPQQAFAAIDSAALSLRLQPLLSRREIEVESVSARGVTLRFARDAEGQHNIDDLLERLSSGSEPRTGKPLTMDSLELADVALELDDAHAGVRGRLAISTFSLGAFGPGLISPLQLKAQAELSEPPMNAALELDAGLSFLPAPQAGAPPVLRLEKTGLRLRGQGFELEGLDLRLQAETIRLEYGAELGLGDSHVEIDGAQLQFGGTRLGWQIDSGQLGLARLRLDILQRTLELDQLALQLKGKRAGTTLDARLRWPLLKVQGDALQGGALEGQLTLGGDQRLQLQVRSQPPSGAFERITVPGLQLDIDGQLGSSALKGQAGATLVLEPKPLALALDAMSLRLRLDDPGLPPLQLSLDGQAQLTPSTGSGRVEGSINDQRVDARFDARRGGARPFVDLQASFGTLDLNRFVAPAQRGAAPAPAAASTPVDLQPLRCGRCAAAHQRGAAAAGAVPRRRPGAAGADRQRRARPAAAGRPRLGRPFRRQRQRRCRQRPAGAAPARRRGGPARDAGRHHRLRRPARSRPHRRRPAQPGRDGGRGALRPEWPAFAGAASGRAAWRGPGADAAWLAHRLGIGQRHGGLRRTAADRVQPARRQLRAARRRGPQHRPRRPQRLPARRRRRQHRPGAGPRSTTCCARAWSTPRSGRAGPEMVMLNGVTVPVELHGPFGNIEWQVRWGSVTAAVAALSVPNVAVGTVSGVARGATGVVRGAAGVLRSVPGALPPGAALTPPACR